MFGSLEECTVFVRGKTTGRKFYVLPEYRSEGLKFSLKNWNPDHPDSIAFSFMADDNLTSRYVLKIGAMDNEKVILEYQSEDKDLRVVKQRTLPNLIFLGQWSHFAIKVPRGKIELYYESETDPIFDWEHPEPKKAFLPVYYNYNSEEGYTVGVAFDCESS